MCERTTILSISQAPRRASITAEFVEEEDRREKKLGRILDRRIADLKANTDYIIQKYTWQVSLQNSQRARDIRVTGQTHTREDENTFYSYRIWSQRLSSNFDQCSIDLSVGCLERDQTEERGMTGPSHKEPSQDVLRDDHMEIRTGG